MADYEYVTFDQEGLATIYCMHCNEMVGKRVEDKIRHFNTWKQVRVRLSDGSYAEPIVCVDCASKPLDLAQIEGSIKFGLMKECVATKQSIDVVRSLGNRLKNLKIIRQEGK